MAMAARVFSSVGLGLDIVTAILTLISTGFFAYVVANTFLNGIWYIDLSVAFSVIAFVLTVASSICGCITSCGKPNDASLYISKFVLDAFAWILMLIAAAICQSKIDGSPASLQDFLNTCDIDFEVPCAFGCGVVFLWTCFCLLFVTSILHILSVKDVKNSNKKDDSSGQQINV